MITTTLSRQALGIINSYEQLNIGGKKINTPYFNNRTSNLRGALRVLVGKGTAQDIIDEARILALREKIDLDKMNNETMVQFLTDHKLGIDCAALAYYTLDAELQATKHKKIKQILSFAKKNFLRRLIAKFRTVENTNVIVLNENSTEIALSELQPGDMIIALEGGPQHDYNHVIIITSTTRNESGNLVSLEYAHAYIWKREGKYTKGIRKGAINITKPDRVILEQEWSEDGKTGEENETWNYLAKANNVVLKRITT